MPPLKEFCDVLTRLSSSEHQNPDTVCEKFEDFRMRIVREVPIISPLYVGSGKDADGCYILVDTVQDSVDSASDKGPLDSDVSTSTVDDGLDVTGSPLRCRFGEEILNYAEDTIISQQSILLSRKGAVVPVEPNRARYLASVYNLSCDHWLKNNIVKEPCPFTPMWIMCNGNDTNKTVALGCYWKEKKLGRSIVSCSGQIKRPSEIMTIEQLRKKHALGIPGKSVYTQVVASYRIEDCSILVPDECTGDILPSSVFLQVKWKSCYKVQESPPSDAQCTITITGKPASDQSLTHSMFEEIERLKELLDRSTTSTAMYDPLSVDDVLVAKLEKLIEEARYTPIVTSRSQACSDQNDVSQPEKSMSSYISRRALDFYDKLWNALKDVENMSDLAKCFEMVFIAASQKKLIKAAKRSATTIATVIAGKTEKPHLIDCVPLELLIEIGIEKLRRDCLHFFNASETATDELLKPYLDHELNTSASLLCLSKLNYIIEVIMTASLSLKLQDSNLRAFTRNILKHYTGHDIGVSFEYQIHSTCVDSWFKGDPENWKLIFTSTDSKITKMTILNLSSYPLAEWILNADSCASGFFQTIMTEIADNILTAS